MRSPRDADAVAGGWSGDADAGQVGCGCGDRGMRPTKKMRDRGVP